MTDAPQLQIVRAAPEREPLARRTFQLRLEARSEFNLRVICALNVLQKEGQCSGAEAWA